MRSPPDSFLSACAAHDLSLPEDRLDLLTRFVEDLLEVNQRMNLTAVREPEQVWMRHVFDSLLLLPRLKADPDQRALDLGSGGGLPGIPLAILRPDMRWTLVDSVGKKAAFLGAEAARLGLDNVEAASERAEVLGRDPAYRESFHLVTARAVARLPVLLEYTVPLLRKGGHLAAMKGAKAGEELRDSRRAMEVLSVRLREQVEQPGGGTLLWFRKRRPTAATFPRGVGIPGQKPL